MLAQLLLVTALGISVQDHLDGSEIGDANLSVTFESGGKYAAGTEGKDKTVAKGTWAVTGDSLEVKVASCKGPQCATVGKSYKADVVLVAERAMTVRAVPPDGPLTTGSYYCHYGGCEKRLGVLLVTHAAKAPVMKYVLDFLIDKNVAAGGSKTVVWWGKRITEKAPATAITYCAREGDRAKKGAEQVARDLAELAEIGQVTPAPSPEKDCLWDVMVTVGDDTARPVKK
jgi:hypothetical protein